MVRLKSRYILFEILTPTDIQDLKEYDSLSLRQLTPVEINSRILLNEIRRSLQVNFGDYGSAKVNSLIHIKYFSNMTSTGIIRCLREDVDLVVSAMALVKNINGLGVSTNSILLNDIIINPVKISGTIKKIEQYAIKRNAKLLRLVQKENSGGKNQLLVDFSGISDKDVEDQEDA
ncbi:hypothetical protein TBLA_0E01890 [Henningerozyma blattae CBS 6284]|uniref:Ribonuclease P/MRP protein subunit POP5 n=1 Tax=Henningerozyma blattae (strain ATCC 34711 / CBS 6284 / DSM 70876 / NBRC 10599 / NRRL Y-10934 / UCD 77-7) TaxID=1071380 RepID=I2H4E1_HENB6|nr:hypothetical protein TBLA_0E01890 [Tetrapisispora blattae CBS 6284]CCH61243.1 hypothetical protein TBLA_0E01890 [Tetrapisispora blattae CBS 6284]